MPPQTASTATEPVPNFAALLAALASAKASNPILPVADPIRDPLADLEPDVATLTYDRALRTHARYRPASIQNPNPNVTSPGKVSPPPEPESAPKEAPAAQNGIPKAASLHNKLEQTRKRASITVRVTQSEYTQLQERAAEAGLTVSAYLRSCTFEVESLRAQVKQTLAELRSSRPASPRAHRRIFSRLFCSDTATLPFPNP